jgi:hypothetical protein
MNGMSLAALLGAATWFGHKVERETTPPEEVDRPAPPAADDVVEQPEFVWAPNPLFQ